MKKTITYFFTLTGCIALLIAVTTNDATRKRSSPCKMEKQSNPISIDQSSNNFFTDNI
jgi:hypothetical protein